MIASSSSSPPTRIDCETTIPPSEMTATSLVPPPMSTIIEPVGSATGRAAPARLLDRALLDAGDAGGHAHHHPRMRPAVLVHLLDEVAQHLLGDIEVGDDA